MRITIKNKLTIQDAPRAFEQSIKTRLTFMNPKWQENDRMGRWNGETPEKLKFCESRNKGELIVPRGFVRQLIGMSRKWDIKYRLIDHRRSLPEVSFSFNGTLRPFQEQAVNNVLARRFGILSAPTGSGKTVMALYAIGQRRQPALIVVHTRELLNQWVDRIETFLGIPKEQVGIIGGGKRIIRKKVTVAMVQSLYKCADKVRARIGFLIVDECHRAPSRTFTEAVTAFDSKYMLGLSATPWRRDKLSRLIYWHLGNIVHEVDKEGLVENGDILKAEVIIRETQFETSLDPSEEYSKMLTELTQESERNQLIAHDVAMEARKGKCACLVLSYRKTHCGAIQNLLWREYKVGTEFLSGDVGKKEREAVVKRLQQARSESPCGNRSTHREGFDCKQLSTLFLVTPIRFSGSVLQYLGRVLRPAPGKDKARVFDYCDVHVGVLKASAEKRARVFNGQRQG